MITFLFLFSSTWTDVYSSNRRSRKCGLSHLLICDAVPACRSSTGNQLGKLGERALILSRMTISGMWEHFLAQPAGVNVESKAAALSCTVLWLSAEFSVRQCFWAWIGLFWCSEQPLTKRCCKLVSFLKSTSRLCLWLCCRFLSVWTRCLPGAWRFVLCLNRVQWVFVGEKKLICVLNIPHIQARARRKWQWLSTHSGIDSSVHLTLTQRFGLPHVSRIISQLTGLVNDILVYYTHVCKQRHMLLVPGTCPSPACYLFP